MIQARCGSSRLQNKVLKDLCGKPVLQRVIERVSKSKNIDEVMVVTSIDKSNLPIISLCAGLGIRVGVGSENDVLDRYYQYARLLRPEYVIRITADCPCFDYGLLDDAIQTMNRDSDYRGMISEQLADGLDLEIIRFEALEKSWREASHSYQREHVTQYIQKHPEMFKIQDWKSPIGYFGDNRWTIDEEEDFQLVEKIYEHFIVEEENEEFNYMDILEFLRVHPEIKAINQMYARNEGLQKSVEEDRVAL